jgi:hypothetical protein
VYLSIPVMASLRILWRHWRTYVEAPVVMPARDVVPSPR